MMLRTRLPASRTSRVLAALSLVAFAGFATHVVGCDAAYDPGSAGGGDGDSGGGTQASSSGGTTTTGSSGGASSSGGTVSGSGSGTGSGSGGTSSGSSSGSGSGSGGTTDDGGATGGDGGLASCAYTDDKSFCACLGSFTCGGTTTKDSTGAFQSVFCGACAPTELCLTSAPDVFIGQCGGTNPFSYQWQWDKAQALVSLGENDNPTPSQNYSFCSNIKDGRGYTIGKVGFCTGTGDFVIVAACYNDAKPGNVLQKYWPALTYYADQYITANANQSDTSKIDAIAKAASTTFKADIATAAADAEFTGCQDAYAAAEDLAPAADHFNQFHMSGALTLGFLYDTELNFGEDDDPPMADGAPGTAGTGTVFARAIADYGAGMPTDFTGKAWEESRFLGFLIYERAMTMSKDPTWDGDMDQDATWEAARRLHTGSSNNPESDTDLSMSYDITSAYKAAYKTPAPCWGDPPLATALDSQSSVYKISLTKPNTSDPTTWTVASSKSGSYVACPANPTP